MAFWKRHRAAIAIAGLALLAGLPACDDGSYEKGYRDGAAEGYETGYNEGTRDGASRTTLKYESQFGWYGFIFGILLGGGLVALLTRRYIASELRKWRNRREVADLVGRCPVDLDVDIRERVMAIGLRKRRLEGELAREDNRLVGHAHAPLLGTLAKLDESTLKLATLLQQLRSIRQQVAVDEESARSRIEKLQDTLGKLNDGSEKGELESALEMERRKLAACQKNGENVRRCERKLDTLSAFLDNLIIEVGNMRTLEEQGAFEQFESKVSEEIDSLRRLYEDALSNISTEIEVPPLEPMDDR